MIKAKMTTDQLSGDYRVLICNHVGTGHVFHVLRLDDVGNTVGFFWVIDKDGHDFRFEFLADALDYFNSL